ncbi:MAG: HAD family phosphatase [Granulosicoccus sp.]|nr:HAD family phosphatase [Granulosicoccus sp.]
MISHLIFDLGGVIVELRGPPVLPQWADDQGSVEQMWEKWLTSDAPRAFESGQIGEAEFSSRVVEELSLNISATEFIDYFRMLPIGPYSGAIELLQSLRPLYTTALFSNSNPMHWHRKMNEMHLGSAFDHHFASHLMGLVKPDEEAFTYVLKALGVPASDVLFFDDNQLNVDAALAAGMQSQRVCGIDALRNALQEKGIGT